MLTAWVRPPAHYMQLAQEVVILRARYEGNATASVGSSENLILISAVCRREQNNGKQPDTYTDRSDARRLLRRIWVGQIPRGKGGCKDCPYVARGWWGDYVDIAFVA